MFSKRLGSVICFVGFALLAQSVLFVRNSSSHFPSVGGLSFLQVKNVYTVTGDDSGCCTGLKRAVVSALRSCFGCCCSSSDEEPSPEGDYVPSSPVPSISGGLVGHPDSSSRRTLHPTTKEGKAIAEELHVLRERYDDFGCTRNDPRGCCRHISNRIRFLEEKLFKAEFGPKNLRVSSTRL